MIDYISVQQYAEKHGVERTSVNKWIAAGLLKAEKLGKYWVIHKDEPRPPDLRVKSGKYINFRKGKNL